MKIKIVKRVVLAVGVVVVAVVAVGITRIGPGNVIGMLRYDTRKEGALRPGSAAPDVRLHGLKGAETIRIAERIGARPLVLIFGSFT
jgi:hypothetical protein